MDAAPDRPLTKNIRADGEPPGIDEYRRAGGYRALEKAVKTMSPAEVLEEVKRSKLRGRGGAGFSTGLKWSFVPMGDKAEHPKYVVCNADEMEPGTFKDRLLMEKDPHQLLEGLLLAAYAIEADVAFVFIRWAYHLASERFLRAISEARDKGYLDPRMLGTALDIDVRIHSSAGRYICGEETGLLNSLEGRRAIPRAKPPFPQTVGLYGRPTVVNNVETLCCLPHIVNHGAAWFAALSRSPNDGGTKLYGASGRVKRPGCWELPMGTTLREILEEHAGGMREGYALRGLLPGGASTDFLLPEHLDFKMDFDSLQAVGSRLGTGTIVVLDDKTCPVGMCENLQHFFARESCGWCTPCREGLPRVEKILHAMEEGQGQAGDVEVLEKQARLLFPGSTFCALAPGAAESLGSAIKYFRDDFNRHVDLRRCPYRS